MRHLPAATASVLATLLLAAGPAASHCGSCGVGSSKTEQAGHDHAGHDHAGHAHATTASQESPLAAVAEAHGMTEAELMARWTAAMTPNEHHERLTALVGTFDFENVHWMTPDADPTTATGTIEGRSILGGRYVEQVYRGDFLGQPFEGRAVTGYDNVQGRYVGQWVDNMGTGIMTSVGDVDASGKRIHSVAEFWDPMTERPSLMREVLTIESPKRHVLEMYHRDPQTNEEFLAMRIVATRSETRAGQ